MIPSPDDLARAYALTRQTTVRTPLLDAPALAAATGAAQVWVKAENLQKAGSFKIRGAIWRLAQLTPDERARGVIAFSSGNFAQGLAAAGRAAGVPVTIVMPHDAPVTKARATRDFGARLILSDHGTRPREEVAAELARTTAADEGLVLLHPFDDPAIVAGQAGVALEALEQLDAIGGTADIFACPTGGGGLIGGLSLAVSHHSPQARIFAVEPRGFDSMGTALTQGAPTRLPPTETTICDALQAAMAGAAPFAAARAAGVTGVSVTDDSVRRAMQLAHDSLGLILEPSGAAAIAALLSGRLPVVGRRALLIASGGNISPDGFCALSGVAPDALHQTQQFQTDGDSR